MSHVAEIEDSLHKPGHQLVLAHTRTPFTFRVSLRLLNRLCLVFNTVFLLEIEKTEVLKSPSEELKQDVSPVDLTYQTTGAMLSCRSILSKFTMTY